jgi:hypothetical protein
MDLKDDKVLKVKHPDDLISEKSLLKDFRYTETLEFDQNYEGITGSGITPGAKRASEPNASFQEITVRPGQSIHQAAEILREQGGGVIKLLAGTHKPLTDIPIYSTTTVRGESTSQTIVDFGSTSGNFIMTGTDVYTIGTIASTSGTVVTGSGTTWTSAMVGRQMFIDNRWYLIVAYLGPTTLIIESPYADGASYSGTYRIADVIRDVEFEELTIKNSTGTAISGTDVRDIYLEDVTLVTNGQGVSFTNFMAIDILRVPSVGCSSNGWSMTNGSFFNARECATIGNGGSGMVMNTVKIGSLTISASNSNANDGYNCTTVSEFLFNVEASSNGGQGIEFVSGCNNNTISPSIIKLNTSDGIKLTATSDNNTIGTGCTIMLNAVNGINIAAATCDNNIIIGSHFALNGTAVADSGTGTLIRSNQGVADAP